tara:strand:- start:192 stop:734 length:543 start_codon:yes stop_codon:yes gene_type:complete
MPSVKDIYKKKRNKKIKLKKSDFIMCAKFRNGHFEGVLDVIERFLLLIKPKFIFMGEKDFQQLFLIKKFFKNKFNTKIISCPTIRNKNKLALSSRNFLLKKRDQIKAEIIAKYLINLKKSILKKNKSLSNEKKYLEKKFSILIEYLEVRNIHNLKTANFKRKFRLFVAYYINGIRLIDNF